MGSEHVQQVAPPSDAQVVDQLRADISAAVDALEPELIEVRRDLHAHPELGFAEQRTTTRISQRLKAEALAVVASTPGDLDWDKAPDPTILRSRLAAKKRKACREPVPTACGRKNLRALRIIVHERGRAPPPEPTLETSIT